MLFKNSLIGLSSNYREKKYQDICDSWFRQLERRLTIDEPDLANPDPYGFQWGVNTKYMRWAVIESLIPAAQALASDMMLESIARLRYGIDHTSIEMFTKTHNKW